MKQVFILAISCLALCCQTSFSQQITRPLWQEKFIELPTGVTLEYAEQGNANGIPVILLHGFTDSWRSFAAVLPHLPSQLHVFVLSQRGHGNSSKAAGTYKPEDFASDIAAFMKEKKLRDAVIIGHSMGSTNAQCFAAKYPAKTKALVLIGSFANYDKPAITEFKEVINGLKDPIDSTFIAGFQQSTLANPITQEMLGMFIDESRKVPAHVWKGVAAGWSTAGYLDALQGFNKPALIIWGDKDAYSPKEDQLLLLAAMRKATLLVYEGTGHANQWEEPLRFARDITRFINGIPAETK